MRRLLLDCALATGRGDNIDEDTVDAMADTFLRILDGQVPEDRVEECYLYAMRVRRSTFMIAASELLEAWDTLGKKVGETVRVTGCRFCKWAREQGKVGCTLHSG